MDWLSLASSLNKFLQEHECLLAEEAQEKGTRRFPLVIPVVTNARGIHSAWVEVPPDFESRERARIMIPKDYALRIPHVESDGRVCIDGDPGPTSGASPSKRIDQLIDLFYSSFLEPWLRGDLDSHFEEEAMSYWAIHCARNHSAFQPINKIYTTDEKSEASKVYKSIFIESQGVVIAGAQSALRSRILTSLSEGSKVTNIMVAEIPISFPFVPDTWPKAENEIKRLISVKCGPSLSNKFFTSEGRRGRQIHRVVIFRAEACAYGYLLPGGPPAIIRKGQSTKYYPSNRLIPLDVERTDVSWTTGRDQHPEHIERQRKHVLMIGAGALGSPVAEQLAKAGIGKITIVDSDYLSSANIGRHVLGATSIGNLKAVSLAAQISREWPSCVAVGAPQSLEKWLKTNSFQNFDLILDLTGESTVRLLVDIERRRWERNLVIAWMEPYVAAAHACILPCSYPWLTDTTDRLEQLNAVSWPQDVIQRVPGCSSAFQSYTSAAAAHAVALTTEATLDILDDKVSQPLVRHWVRGQSFLDRHYGGIELRDWAIFAKDFDGTLREFDL